MSTSAARSQIQLPRGSPPPVAWRSWPVASGGRSAWLFLAGLAAVGAVVWFSTARGHLAAIACGLVALAGWRQWVPATYEVNALGVTQHILWRTRRYAWKSIERAEIGRQGVFLAPDGAPLAALRGFYVPWEGHRDELIALVEYYLPGSRMAGPPNG